MAIYGNTTAPNNAMVWSGYNNGYLYEVGQNFGSFGGGTVTDVYVYYGGHAGYGGVTSQLCIWNSAGTLVWASGQFTAPQGNGGIGGQSWNHVGGLNLNLSADVYYIGFWRSSSQTVEFSTLNGSNYYENGDTSAGSLTGGSWESGTIGAYFVYNPPPPPSIGYISPTSGIPGTSITIGSNGATFTSTQGSVSFSGTNATITAWSATSITCNVPSMAAGSVSVTVTTAYGTSGGYGFTVLSPDQPPNTPTLQNPSSGATVNSLTPLFQGTFSDPTGGDYLGQYRIQVQNSSGTIVWDTGNVAASSSEIAAAQFSRNSGTSLSFGQSYSWRAAVANQNGLWSSFSGWQSFSVVNGPNTPNAILPSGLQTTTAPAWSFQYNSPSAVNLAYYHVVVEAQGNNTWIYDSGMVAYVVGSGTTVTGNIPYGICNWGGAYNFYCMVQDANGAQSAWGGQSFTIAAIPQVSPLSPINNQYVGSSTPTYTWSYSDPNYTEGSWQIQVYNNSTGALIEDTGIISGSATSHLSGVAVAYGTHIRWHIQVWDTAGLGSGYSSWQYAYVDNTPSAAVTSPTNNSTITTNTPTVTWTYTASSGGQVQSSASVSIMDTYNNPLQSYSLIGTGTSLTIPVGLLQNGTTYHLQVTVTDTNGVSGLSSIITFTVTFPSPLDITGLTYTGNAGSNSDPVTANGGTITISWNISTDSRFIEYYIERKRSDQTAYTLLTTITSKSVTSYTDYTAGGTTIYQYAVRQQIMYPDGSYGMSPDRAVISASVNFSPAWYLVNTDVSVYNFRFNYVDIKRQNIWKERATYNAFLGRIGTARDSGSPAGYSFKLVCYFNDSWGDNRQTVRRTLVAMQELNVTWNLKDPDGLVVPMYLGDIQLDETDAGGDTLLMVTFQFLQVADTADY